MRHYIPLWLLLALLLPVTTACESVASEHLLGREADVDTTQKLVGLWMQSGDALRITSPGGGQLRLVRNGDAEDAFDVLATLTTHRGAQYLQFRVRDVQSTKPTTLLADAPEDMKDMYVFFRVVVAGGKMPGDQTVLLLFPPNVHAFFNAVRRHKLQGVARHIDTPFPSEVVWVRGIKADWDSFVRPEKAGEQFSIDSPIVLELAPGENPPSTRAATPPANGAPQ